MARFQKKEQSEFEEKIVHISRVAKVVKGGRRFSFSALVVVGDRKGRVGVGLGKASEVPDAIRKAIERAQRNLTRVPLVDSRTLPHAVIGHYGAARVVIRPASPGTGVIAGGAVRAVMESAGVHDVLTKVLGTNNPHNVVKATIQGLTSLKSANEYQRRLKGVVASTEAAVAEEVAPTA